MDIHWIPLSLRHAQDRGFGSGHGFIVRTAAWGVHEVPFRSEQLILLAPMSLKGGYEAVRAVFRRNYLEGTNF